MADYSEAKQDYDKPSPKKDPKKEIDGPKHYKGYRVLEFIDEFSLSFELGNSVKYIARCNRKNEDPIDDLNKALFYLVWEIKLRGGKPVYPEFLKDDKKNKGDLHTSLTG